MDKIFVFRVILDTADDDIFRDIEIVGSQTLEDLHKGILDAFGIAPGEMASFYASDDNWNQGDEVPLIDMGFGKYTMGLMSEMKLEDWVAKIGKRSLYLYDYLNMWTFFVELFSTKEEDLSKKMIVITSNFPKTVYVYGQNPKHAPEKNFGDEQKQESKGLFDDAFDNDEDDEFGDDEQSFNDYHDEW